MDTIEAIYARNIYYMIKKRALQVNDSSSFLIERMITLRCYGRDPIGAKQDSGLVDLWSWDALPKYVYTRAGRIFR